MITIHIYFTLTRPSSYYDRPYLTGLKLCKTKFITFNSVKQYQETPIINSIYFLLLCWKYSIYKLYFVYYG